MSHYNRDQTGPQVGDKHGPRMYCVQDPSTRRTKTHRDISETIGPSSVHFEVNLVLHVCIQDTRFHQRQAEVISIYNLTKEKGICYPKKLTKRYYIKTNKKSTNQTILSPTTPLRLPTQSSPSPSVVLAPSLIFITSTSTSRVCVVCT
jgi:hypothetical protein